MSVPFGDFGCSEKPPLSAVWGARPFATTHRQPGHARLTGAVLPRAVDAGLTTRSGFAGRAVGGVFYGGGLHAANHRFFCAFELLNSTQQS